MREEKLELKCRSKQHAGHRFVRTTTLTGRLKNLAWMLITRKPSVSRVSSSSKLDSSSLIVRCVCSSGKYFGNLMSEGESQLEYLSGLILLLCVKFHTGTVADGILADDAKGLGKKSCDPTCSFEMGNDFGTALAADLVGSSTGDTSAVAARESEKGMP